MELREIYIDDIKRLLEKFDLDTLRAIYHIMKVLEQKENA